MGNVSLKVHGKSLNFFVQKGYKPSQWWCREISAVFSGCSIESNENLFDHHCSESLLYTWDTMLPQQLTIFSLARGQFIEELERRRISKEAIPEALEF